MKVCIDAGHGGKDSGAVGGGIKEKDIALSISKKLRDYLKSYNVDVYMTRETDVYDSVTTKAKKGNSSNADLFLSIHCNSATSESANGVEVLVYKNTGDNKKAGESILNSIVEELILRNRGVKERPDLAVLRDTKMTAVLVETGFISNVGDRAVLLEKQSEFSKAIGDGVLRYFGIEVRKDKDMEKRYNTIEEVPSWAREKVKKLIDEGKFADVNKLDLSYDMVRLIVILS
ncbi:MAG: N-acetylmuramoyl-L-alanine amidase [Tyzzerella sp.]|uniref:N-acetylmuramoyl-L-alanine amidase n=1 Tax=Candidatus Fimicola merdigallinarum TaxID=2840819 RepID=A0A9D9DTF8_9FIRM|nr:N-acetylmuramoyl-L-alanine amidase [Candidatus Fimicola merdigallinarum]